jgi:hypothetical protein
MPTSNATGKMFAAKQRLLMSMSSWNGFIITSYLSFMDSQYRHRSNSTRWISKAATLIVWNPKYANYRTPPSSLLTRPRRGGMIYRLRKYPTMR